MSTEMQTQSVSLTIADRARAIDRISSSAMEAFESAESFEKELAVAQAVLDMRAALTAEVMQPVMGLMNTSLGFRTDRDPTMAKKFDADGKGLDSEGKPIVPYTVEVVREVFIESRLRGFHSVGNEFNIISGRFYGCVAGFERKCRTHSKVTDLRDTYDPPRLVGDKGAIVKASCTWKQDGASQRLEREFPVRVNAGMGADAIIGKAKRKLFAAVLAQLTGKVTPEGEIGDDPVIEIKATGSTIVEASDLFKGKSASQAATEPAQAGSAPAKDLAPAAEKPGPDDRRGPLVPIPHEELYSIVNGNGFTFDDLANWAKKNGYDLGGAKAFDKIPVEICKRLIGAKNGLLNGLAAQKRK